MALAAGIIFSAAVTATSTGIAIKNSNDAKDEAQKTVDEEKAKEAKLETQQTDAKKNTEQAQSQAASATQKAAIAAAQPRGQGGGTILTSPLGLVGQPQTAQKTLLGS